MGKIAKKLGGRRERLKAELLAMRYRPSGLHWVKWQLGWLRWRCDHCGGRKPLAEMAQFGTGPSRCRSCLPEGGQSPSAGGPTALPAGQTIADARAEAMARARVQEVLAKRLQQRR